MAMNMWKRAHLQGGSRRKDNIQCESYICTRTLQRDMLILPLMLAELLKYILFFFFLYAVLKKTQNRLHFPAVFRHHITSVRISD